MGALTTVGRADEHRHAAGGQRVERVSAVSVGYGYAAVNGHLGPGDRAVLPRLVPAVTVDVDINNA